MATDILLAQGTSIEVEESGGDVVFTPKNIGDNAARMSASIDLGAAFARRYHVLLESKLQVAPVAGKVIEVFWASSPDNSKWPGKVTGSDGAYPATIDENKVQLTWLGTLKCHNTTDAQVDTCQLAPLSRYGVIVWVNKTGQTLTNTAGDHIVTLTPTKDQIQ